MDVETIKLVLPLVAGVFVVLSAILFFTGRSTEASSTTDRLLGIAAIIFNLLGLAAIVLKLGYWPIASFAIGFGLQIWEFLRRPGRASRAEVVLISLLSVIFVTLLVSIVLFQVLDRLIDIVDRTMSIMERFGRRK